MATYKLIDKTTLTSTQSSVSFSGLGSFSSIYTDLKLLVSARMSNNAQWYYVYLNGSSSNYSNNQIYGSGSSTSPDTGSTPWSGAANASVYTANSFGNSETPSIKIK